jgi:hypothetical protein
MSDEELDVLYKRYKVMQHQNDDRLVDVEAEAYELVQQFNAGSAKNQEDRQISDPSQLENELGLLLNKTAVRRKFNA